MQFTSLKPANPLINNIIKIIIYRSNILTYRLIFSIILSMSHETNNPNTGHLPEFAGNPKLIPNKEAKRNRRRAKKQRERKTSKTPETVTLPRKSTPPTLEKLQLASGVFEELLMQETYAGKNGEPQFLASFPRLTPGEFGIINGAIGGTFDNRVADGETHPGEPPVYNGSIRYDAAMEVLSHLYHEGHLETLGRPGVTSIYQMLEADKGKHVKKEKAEAKKWLEQQRASGQGLIESRRTTRRVFKAEAVTLVALNILFFPYVPKAELAMLKDFLHGVNPALRPLEPVARPLCLLPVIEEQPLCILDDPQRQLGTDSVPNRPNYEGYQFSTPEPNTVFQPTKDPPITVKVHVGYGRYKEYPIPLSDNTYTTSAFIYPTRNSDNLAIDPKGNSFPVRGLFGGKHREDDRLVPKTSGKTIVILQDRQGHRKALDVKRSGDGFSFTPVEPVAQGQQSKAAKR